MCQYKLTQLKYLNYKKGYFSLIVARGIKFLFQDTNISANDDMKGNNRDN